METLPPPGADVLDALRRELDAIDAVLLNTLLLRFRCTARIGAAKGAHAIPVMQPERVRTVLRRAGDFAEQHHLNPHALQDVFAVLIADACREEDGHPLPPASARRVEEIARDIENRAYSAY